MAADLALLAPAFRVQVERLLDDCARAQIIMRPFSTLRTPHEQARLWRQSRPREQIDKTIRNLQKLGGHWLASVLEEVGPQYGRHVTNALASWHNWGLAVDCFWFKDGKAEWTDLRGYRVYANGALARELTPGGGWEDWPHVQLPRLGVAARYTWPEIEAEMVRRFH